MKDEWLPCFISQQKDVEDCPYKDFQKSCPWAKRYSCCYRQTAYERRFSPVVVRGGVAPRATEELIPMQSKQSQKDKN